MFSVNFRKKKFITCRISRDPKRVSSPAHDTIIRMYTENE